MTRKTFLYFNRLTGTYAPQAERVEMSLEELKQDEPGFFACALDGTRVRDANRPYHERIVVVETIHDALIGFCAL